MVYTISISVWITSINAHRVYNASCWWNEIDNILMIVLTSRITQLEKLQETRIQVIETTGFQQWNIIVWSQQKNLLKNSILVIMFCGFQRANKSHLGKFTRKWFGPYKIQYVLLNNIVLLMTIEKFTTNHVLVNVNKLKPYKYMEFEVQKQE